MFFSVLFVGLAGFAGLAYDAGNLFAKRREAHNLAAAAARAGANDVTEQSVRDGRPEVAATAASACIAYPQGLATEAAGGARREVLPPGSRSRVDYAVRVGAGEDAVGVKVVSEELRASC